MSEDREEALQLYREIQQTYERTAKNLVHAKKLAYPVDMVVTIKAGKGTADIRITEHPTDWWNDPTDLIGVNVRTGNRKRFNTAAIIEIKEENA
jgi:hypothetical protein